ncbi:MAG: FecR domain-containing protein [Prolixibacteraceae bacterium]|nr:FecR domain-containing protein [Prolixibacteraceae bacterium]
MSKHSNKTDFLSLVQDENFIQLVIDAENPNELLKELQTATPDQSDALQYAFEFISVNHGNKIKMSPEDYNQVLSNILLHLKKKPKNRFYQLFPLPLRIAASILLILAISSIVVYRQFEKDPLTKFAQIQHEGENQALIVLSDGTTKVLKNNDSFIDYSSNKGEVVVKNTEEEERIGNSRNEKNAAMNQVVVPYGQRHKVLLSDGTLVQLNAGSRLTFPAAFSGKTREVYLKGEGFFEVSENVKQPFIVKTDHIDIKVLGTTFNVSAYEDEGSVATVLVEGKVNVSQKDKLLANEEFTLTPGQGCFYSVDAKNSVVRNVDIMEHVLWKEGLFNFKDKPLRDVVSRVHKYFNRPIQIESDKLANTLVSGKLVLSDDLTEVIEYLSKTVEGKYEVKPDGLIVLKQ